MNGVSYQNELDLDISHHLLRTYPFVQRHEGGMQLSRLGHDLLLRRRVKELGRC